MVVIRLARGGSKKNPFYHLVVADRRMPRDGRFIERVGYYNPMARGKDIRLTLEKERLDYWVSQGAKPSERVAGLVKQFEKAPEEAQKAGMSRIEIKQRQAEESAKARKKAEQEAKKAEAAAKAEEAAEASKEAAAEDQPTASEEPAPAKDDKDSGEAK